MPLIYEPPYDSRRPQTPRATAYVRHGKVLHVEVEAAHSKPLTR